MKKILTGQQTGLLGGPLYTTFKVLTAIRLAEEYREEAVYWLETNDADFREISVIDYINSRGELKSLRWNLDTGGSSTGQVRVDDNLVEILNTFFRDIQQTDFTSELRNLVLNCYKKGDTLESASLKLAAEIFRDFKLTLFAPTDRDFRRHSKAILLREADRTKSGNQCNLFIMDGDIRKGVFKTDEGFSARDGRVVNLKDYDLVPNVRTRNLCQDSFFNTHIYVAGPGEIKYIAELSDWYRYHEVKPAEVVPRMSLTFKEPRVKRLLGKCSLSLEEIVSLNRSDIPGRIAAQNSGETPGEKLKKAMAAGETFLKEIEAFGFNSRKIGKTLRTMIKEEAGRVRKEIKDKNSSAITAAESVSDLLRPYGKPQERVFNIFYYMNKYGGISFVKWLYDNYKDGTVMMEVDGG